jgi:hypothetical protein
LGRAEDSDDVTKLEIGKASTGKRIVQLREKVRQRRLLFSAFSQFDNIRSKSRRTDTLLPKEQRDHFVIGVFQVFEIFLVHPSSVRITVASKTSPDLNGSSLDFCCLLGISLHVLKDLCQLPPDAGGCTIFPSRVLDFGYR